MLFLESTSPRRNQSFSFLANGSPIANFWYMIWAIRDGVEIECASGGTGTAAFWKWHFSFGLSSSPHSVHLAICWTICFRISLAGQNSNLCAYHTFSHHFHLSTTDTAFFICGRTYSSTSCGKPASISLHTPGWRGVLV